MVMIVLGAGAAGVAAVVRRRDVDPPEQGASWEVPDRLDRHDFVRPDAEWLVVLFSSSTCLACAGSWEKAELLESDAVAAQRVDAVDDRNLHERYGIDAVPMLVIADGEGVVRRQFVGEPTATDLWAAVAALRDPTAVPEGCSGSSGGPCGFAGDGSGSGDTSD